MVISLFFVNKSNYRILSALHKLKMEVKSAIEYYFCQDFEPYAKKCRLLPSKTKNHAGNEGHEGM